MALWHSYKMLKSLLNKGLPAKTQECQSAILIFQNSFTPFQISFTPFLNSLTPFGQNGQFVTNRRLNN